MKIVPKMTKLQFAMLLVTFFGPPCILETIIAFIVVLITCVYVLGLTVCVELWTSTRYIIVTANVTIIAVDERMLFLNRTWD